MSEEISTLFNSIKGIFFWIKLNFQLFVILKNVSEPLASLNRTKYSTVIKSFIVMAFVILWLLVQFNVSIKLAVANEDSEI